MRTVDRVNTPLRFVAATALVLLAAGCGAADPTASDEYAAVEEERDELQATLAATESELDEVDDALAVAESRLADAETEIVRLEQDRRTDETLGAEFEQLLHADLTNRVGMADEQADCATEALVADDDARAAYLFLVDGSSSADADDASASLDVVSAVFADCGLELADAEPSAPIDAAALGDVTVAGAALPRFDDGGTDPALGTEAPVVSGADYEGNPVTIDAATDGPTMVMVLAHWCPHCNAEIPRVNQLRDEGRVPDGVDIVAVSTGISPDRPNYPPADWIEASDWTYPVIADGVDSDTGTFVAAEAYGTTAFPFVVLLDGEGRVVQRWAGETDVTVLESALRTLVAG